MFDKEVYLARRRVLMREMSSGVILLLGHDESPINFAANVYPFRQESTFLYYVGLDTPALAALLDIDAETVTVFGNEVTVEQLVWVGRQPSLRERCERVGVDECRPLTDLADMIEFAQRRNRPIHLMPHFRPETELKLDVLIEGAAEVSVELARTVIRQRSIKAGEEVAEIESALEVSHRMHTLAMHITEPGSIEHEVVGLIEGMVLAQGLRCSFPTIFSVRGEILHNPTYLNNMAAGHLVVHDSGIESLNHYASDITRTIPVSGRFSAQQQDIYAICLRAQEQAIKAVRPGAAFREIHRLAAVELCTGLKHLGLLSGSPEEAVEAGAHALFFPCGLGHMLGLDVHDMEGIDEDLVGYTDTIKRDPAFGWRSLRLARALEPGFVITVEPGIYFIPELIDRWQSEHKYTEFINYQALARYRSFGGVRIEDDVLVTEEGYRVLGPRIPKTISEVEAACQK